MAADDLPDADDDAGDPSTADDRRAAPPSDSEDDAPRGRKPVETESADDDPRAAAVRRYREIRDREEAAAKTAREGEPPAAAAPEDEAPADAGDENIDEPVVSEEKPAEKPKTTVKLKVHGKEEEVSLEEAISLAQIAKASDNMFNEAKRLLKLAEEQSRSPRSSEQPEHQPASPKSATKPNPSEGQPDPEHPPVAGLDPEKLQQIAERIQVGDAAEGAQALTELISEIANKANSKPSMTADDVDQRVESRLRQQRTQEEIDAALADFGRDYPEVLGKKYLASAGREILADELAKDLRAAGLTDEQITDATKDERTLIAVHRDLRSRNNPNVRGYSDLFKAAGKTLSSEFGLKSQTAKPTPPPVKTAPQRAPTADPAQLQARIDRKRAAPQQPRAAGVRAPVAQPPQPKSTRDVVAMMRQSRGFPSTR